MPTPNSTLDLLNALITEWESECVEFKDANDNFSTSDIGKYFSALANEANLRGIRSAWLVFGVENKKRHIIGTAYREDSTRLQSLKHQIAQGTDPSTTFREIHEVLTPEGHRVLLFEIPPAPKGMPIAWNGHFYARSGESLAALSLVKQDDIRKQSIHEDWSSVLCRNATLKDLSPEALRRAREIFVERQRDRIPEATIRGWDDMTFLEKLSLASGGFLNRACLLLLGNPETELHINPSVAEMSWKLEGPEIDYEHFGPPFLLNTSLLFQKIRNLRLTLLPPGQLIPVEMKKYDQRVVLEALHNCIAHQDYTRCERILVIERMSELEIRNAGSFFEGTPADYIASNRTPSVYRNRTLAQAMMRLRMIDTMGLGIREVMFRGQAERYFPLPDYDLADPTHVVVKIQGRFLDENYSRTLITHAELPWPEVLALDSVQKGREPEDAALQSLRKKGLVEGRKPALRVASDVAAATEETAEYIRFRAFDDAYFCDLILDYLRTFQKGRRADFERLLAGKLSSALTAEQQENKINNLLQKLRREGKLCSEGRAKTSVWTLPEQRDSPR